MTGVLLPRNHFKFPLVKVMLSEIAYKNLINTKNRHFLRMDHRNVIHENFFRGLGDVICIKNLFKWIRVINRTNSRAIWTRIREGIAHFSKSAPFPSPSKKNPQHFEINRNKARLRNFSKRLERHC